MEERVNSIPIYYPPENQKAVFLPAAAPGPEGGGGAPRYTRHFSQTEDFFLRFNTEYLTPRFRIHHDFRRKEPAADYLAALGEALEQLLPLAPDVFSGLTYFFDPLEVFKPCFFKLYSVGESLFLYLLRLDFGFRPHYQQIVVRGDNDVSHSCRTSCLFMEPHLIPLARADFENGRLHEAGIKSLISETWIGEYGRGYFVQGIWMDNDLTKFFTKLFLAPGQRLYPYYPLLCKYRTVCAALLSFAEAERAPYLALFQYALGFLEPVLAEIQAALKDAAFSETLPVFQSLKAKIDRSFGLWEKISIRTYLNEMGQKEYQIDEHLPTA